jgi:hypothetical protein
VTSACRDRDRLLGKASDRGSHGPYSLSAHCTGRGTGSAARAHDANFEAAAGDRQLLLEARGPIPFRASQGVPMQSTIVPRLLLGLFALCPFASRAGAQQLYYSALMDGAQETPPVATTATGFGSFVIDTAANTITYHIEFSGLTSAETAAHIHGFAPPGTPAGILFALPLGNPKIGTIQYNDPDEQNILAGLTYVNVHSSLFPNGEIRGQILATLPPAVACPGDGTLTTCPCGNNSPTGSNQGCINSLGTGGTLTASGFASLSSESLTLAATGIPTGMGVFFQGDSLMASPVFQGNGLRCAGGALTRLKTTATQNNGTVVFPGANDPSASQQGQVTQPGTRIYQVWYTDPNPSFCVATFNVTNAIVVTWVP